MSTGDPIINPAVGDTGFVWAWTAEGRKTVPVEIHDAAEERLLCHFPNGLVQWVRREEVYGRPVEEVVNKPSTT